jgi:hypothetical protein
LLRESAEKLPGNAEVQYHVGMAAYRAGDKQAARNALNAAVRSASIFRGKDEARAVLGDLK